MKKLILVLAAGAIAAISPAHADSHSDKAMHKGAQEALAEAVAAEWRDDDRNRDAYRHPSETIEFFQIKQGMTIADYAPGSWYAKILIPYLGDAGTYIGMIRSNASSSARNQAAQRVFPERYPRLIAERKARAGIKGGANVKAINTLYIPEELEGSVDRVLVMRMMHNLYRNKIASVELANFRKLLKDDGLLGIVQHRAGADAPHAYADGSNGYMRQQDVIKLVEAHGFELVATSEINANPKDSADHAGGVWQLPPVWRSRDEALRQVGESDRMTLLFKKRL